MYHLGPLETCWLPFSAPPMLFEGIKKDHSMFNASRRWKGFLSFGPLWNIGPVNILEKLADLFLTYGISYLSSVFDGPM